MEHLNRLAKTAVDGLGANKTEKAIDRVGKTIDDLRGALDNYDKENNVRDTSGAHTCKSSTKDMSKVLDELLQKDVSEIIPGREHKAFCKLKPNLIKTLDKDSLDDWMTMHLSQQLHSQVRV